MTPLPRGDYLHQIFLHVQGRDPASGSPVFFGWHSGAGEDSLTIEGVSRTFKGGIMIDADPIKGGVSLDVINHSCRLNAADPEVLSLVQGQAIRLGDYQVWVRRSNPITGETLAEDRMFRGEVDGYATTIGPVGGGDNATVKIEAAGVVRLLTRPLTLKKSDESFRRRSGDRWFKNAAIGTVQVKILRD